MESVRLAGANNTDDEAQDEGAPSDHSCMMSFV